MLMLPAHLRANTPTHTVRKRAGPDAADGATISAAILAAVQILLARSPGRRLRLRVQTPAGPQADTAPLDAAGVLVVRAAVLVALVVVRARGAWRRFGLLLLIFKTIAHAARKGA